MDQITTPALDQDFIASQNAPLMDALEEDYTALGRALDRRGIAIEAITEAVGAFAVAAPTWAVGSGGTRFARFPMGGEPRHIFDKLEDCAVVNALGGATPTVSPHFPGTKHPISPRCERWRRPSGLASTPLIPTLFRTTQTMRGIRCLTNMAA